MRNFLSTCLLSAALTLMSGPLFAQQPVDPYTSACAGHIANIGKDAIDGVATLFDVAPAANGKPIFVDEVNKITLGAPPKLVNQARKQHWPAWFSYHFQATKEAVAGVALDQPRTSFKGLTLNLVIATSGGCTVSDDIPTDIHRVPKQALMLMAINQTLIRPDGTYATMDPAKVAPMMNMTEDEYINTIDNFLINKVVATFKQ